MTYANEIIGRRRQAKADEAFPWHATFEELTVGLPFRTPARRVSEQDVAAFAVLTGDDHPQHLDPGFAKASRHGERVAQSLLVVSLAAGLIPWDPRRVVALHRIAEATFAAPVRLGDEIALRGSVAALTNGTDPQAGLVTLEWTVVTRDEEVACHALVEVLWHRDEHFGKPGA
jgi:3-hydroxybutyryl-CoA dehydratase